MEIQRPVQNSIFPKLPTEVLHSILNLHEYPHADDLSNFRLVCRLMNDVVGHSALRVLRLSGSKAKRMRAAQLDAFTKNTRVLKLWRAEENSGDAEVKSQYEEAICDVLQQLVNVQVVEWKILRVLESVLAAIGHLPRLESVSLLKWSFTNGTGTAIHGLESDGRVSPGIDTRLASHLVGLKSFTIQVDWVPWADAGITEELRHLLSASPGIDRFEVLGPAEHRPSLNFISLVEGALGEPVFQPSLRELNLQSLHIPTSSVGRALQYLANLTSLTVSNVEPYHQELWKAFANRSIKLKELTVEEPTHPLVDYLGTYRGLQLFCLKHLVPGRRYVGKGYISDEVQRGILDEALPHHSESLVDIRFAYPPDHSDFEESWALGEDQILWFMQFPKLKAVTVSMWKGHRGVRFISLYHAFQGLFASLPPTVRLVRVVEHLWPATAGPKDLKKFEDLRLTGPIIDYHLKELSYLGFRWYLIRDPTDGKYRFEMDDYAFLDSPME